MPDAGWCSGSRRVIFPFTAMQAAVAPDPKKLNEVESCSPTRFADSVALHLSPLSQFETLRLQPANRLNPEQLSRFCQENDELRIEQTAEGELIIMLPLHTDDGSREISLIVEFAVWSKSQHEGKLFGSNAGWTLPDGAMRAPDVSWVRQERLDALTPEQWQSFAPLCPDFVVELRSRTDRLATLQEKMAEYVANGPQLGWLIDPLERQVFVYRPGREVEHLPDPVVLSGEPVLAGFTLDLARVW